MTGTPPRLNNNEEPTATQWETAPGSSSAISRILRLLQQAARLNLTPKIRAGNGYLVINRMGQLSIEVKEGSATNRYVLVYEKSFQYDAAALQCLLQEINSLTPPEPRMPKGLSFGSRLLATASQEGASQRLNTEVSIEIKHLGEEIAKDKTPSRKTSTNYYPSSTDLIIEITTKEFDHLRETLTALKRKAKAAMPDGLHGSNDETIIFSQYGDTVIATFLEPVKYLEGIEGLIKNLQNLRTKAVKLSIRKNGRTNELYMEVRHV